MALIKCSNCEKEISDNAKICPQCGQCVVLESIEVEESNITDGVTIMEENIYGDENASIEEKNHTEKNFYMDKRKK